MDIAALDIVILIVLLLGFFRGWRTGFIIQVSSLAGLILAFVFAALLMQHVGDIIESRFGVPAGLGPVIAFVSVFLIVRIAIQGFAAAVKTMMGKFKLSGLDRVSGGITGALKGAIILSLAFLMLGYAHIPGSHARRDSELYQPVYRLVPDAWRYISNRAPAFENFRREVEDRLDMGMESVPV